MGKSSHVGAKMAATMTSLGTPTFFLHPAESLHGDLGRITNNDIVLFLSKSGESDEINRMLPSVKQIGAKTVAVTCRKTSTLSRSCDYHIMLFVKKEASAYNIAPTSSTTVMMVFGDALAVCLEKLSGFTPDDYAVFHPGGALGRKLLFTLADLMAKGEDIPYLYASASVKDAIVEMSSKAVLGGVAIVDDKHHLLGVFTDGDLRRLMKSNDDVSVLERSITEVMTTNPVVMTKDVKAVDALAVMANPEKSVGLLPIINGERKLIGMLSIHDLIKAGF
jgi:arabinose-5-phosphate isomerase